MLKESPHEGAILKQKLECYRAKLGTWLGRGPSTPETAEGTVPGTGSHRSQSYTQVCQPLQRGSSRRAKREEGQTGGADGREVGADAASLQLLSGPEATAVPRASAHGFTQAPAPLRVWRGRAAALAAAAPVLSGG